MSIRVVFCSEHYLWHANGAATSVAYLLRALQEAGADVEAFFWTPPRNRELNGFGIKATRIKKNRVAFALKGADIVLTQGREGWRVIEKANGIPTVFQIREPYSHICNRQERCPNGKGYRNWGTCSMGCLEKNPIFQRNKKAVLSASKLVANSEWMKAIMVRFFGREDITVVNPPIQVLNKSKGDGDEILFVGGSMRKGMRIFFEIAEKFPGRSFAIAGQPLLPKMPNNVRNYGELTDMGVAFRNAKLVLCLDQEPPAFNRVPREAYQYGIPVIASKSGGLPESVGDGGLLVPDFWFADAFAQAIEDLLDDQEKYLELQKKAQEMALKSDTANQFVDLVFGMGAG